ncbi:MAG TPA: 3',5'-cyclic-nucleotide phosphodiesterase [Polyangiaceae bacterium]|nr:3',5'-cyclic-nucleotide phosphodiesterase [Polyangiaceae bacterium]
MELRVVGCHGGETPKHRTSAFVLDGKLALDAGSLTSGLDLRAQMRLQGCLVSHAHLDHIRDLATIADNRCQAGAPPLLVGATRPTLAALKKHFFNNFIWPDFTAIPSVHQPTLKFVELPLERPVDIAGYEVRAVGVSHTIDTAGFIVRTKRGSIAYSGDTGPTDRLWTLLNKEPDLRALLVEVSFPNREQRLATLSGHHTPRTVAEDLRKLVNVRDLPTLLYHIKPVFQAEVERECAKLKQLNITVPKLDERYRF